MMDRWQPRWEEYDGWEKTFIRDVRTWQKKAPATEYYTAQAITGHGVFGKYLKTIKQIDIDICWFGFQEADDPNHTIFNCARFVRHRLEGSLVIGETLSRKNVSDFLARSEESGKAIMEMLRQMMQIKQEEERKRQDM